MPNVLIAEPFAATKDPEEEVAGKVLDANRQGAEREAGKTETSAPLSTRKRRPESSSRRDIAPKPEVTEKTEEKFEMPGLMPPGGGVSRKWSGADDVLHWASRRSVASDGVPAILGVQTAQPGTIGRRQRSTRSCSNNVDWRRRREIRIQGQGRDPGRGGSISLEDIARGMRHVIQGVHGRHNFTDDVR